MPSHSTLEVAWVFPTPDGEVVLVANRTVASYAPLAPHSPASGQTVVAEGSSREVAGLGRGPLAWPLLPSGHRRKAPGLLRLEPRPHPTLHRYSVTCTGRGDTTVTLRLPAAPRHRRVDHLCLVLHAALHHPEAPGAPA